MHEKNSSSQLFSLIIITYLILQSLVLKVSASFYVTLFSFEIFRFYTFLSMSTKSRGINPFLSGAQNNGVVLTLYLQCSFIILLSSLKQCLCQQYSGAFNFDEGNVEHGRKHRVRLTPQLKTRSPLIAHSLNHIPMVAINLYHVAIGISYHVTIHTT